jgi:undecaprenyl diphosphate synthase
LVAHRKPFDLEPLLAPGSEAMRLFHALDRERMPRHVAVIMDGNGRWAKARGLPRVAGHEAGIDSVREVVEVGARLRLEALTLYAFSVENWKRPRSEVSTLMLLLKRYLRKELETLLGNDIRFQPIGRLEELPKSVQQELERARKATASNQGMLFQVALNYGGRAEIVDACRLAAREVDVAGGALDEATLARYLYTAGVPDPDLLIRTSGELRVSNFLLWQIAYAEIWVTDTLWPDFRRQHLLQALVDFQHRDRRYGAVASG